MGEGGRGGRGREGGGEGGGERRRGEMIKEESCTQHVSLCVCT